VGSNIYNSFLPKFLHSHSAAYHSFLVGQPTVTLSFQADTSLVKWMIRLEEVHVDGTVTHVTGKAVSANQLLFGSAQIASLIPGKIYRLSVSFPSRRAYIFSLTFVRLQFFFGSFSLSIRFLFALLLTHSM
jgi:hypothetical protein